MGQNNGNRIKPGFVAVIIAAAVIIIAMPIYQMMQRPALPPPAESEKPRVEASASRAPKPSQPRETAPAVESERMPRETASAVEPERAPSETAPAVEPKREPREPLSTEFYKDEPFIADLDGDGVEDTLTVLRGSEHDTLKISSSLYGDYSEVFDYAFPPKYAQLVAIDTGGNAYSLCVAVDNGGNGGAGGLDGLILYGASDGWVKIASLMDLSYSFDSELTDDLGADIAADSRISSVSYAVDANTGEYDFMLGQYLFSGSVVNGVGFGYTQVHIDVETQSLVTIDQWVRAFS